MFLKLIWKNTDEELYSNKNKHTKKDLNFQYQIIKYFLRLSAWRKRDLYVLAHSILLLESIMQLCCTGLEYVFSLGVEQRTC